jgi:hypothetical protein
MKALEIKANRCNLMEEEYKQKIAQEVDCCFGASSIVLEIVHCALAGEQSTVIQIRIQQI